METEFRNLMEEYTVFLEEMVEREKEKYAALVSYDPKRTDKAVAEQQAFNMRLAQLEERREETQRRAGWEGCTFREIIDRAEGAEKRRSLTCLQDLKTQSTRSVTITAAHFPSPTKGCASWVRQAWAKRLAHMMLLDARVMA